MSDLPLVESNLSEAAIGASLEALHSNWLTMGPRTQALESAFAERHGVGHAVAVANAGAGLHLACLAAGVGPGDEVVVPAVAAPQVAHAAPWCGARSVIVDVESPTRPFLDLAAAEAALGERTRAVIVVHPYGYAAGLDGLARRCRERGIALIEDCSEAAGARAADGKPVGGRGLAAAFSFFAETRMPVGEGGIVISGDEDVAAKVRLLRSHAMTSVTWDRHRGHAETYDVVDLGFNYRMDEPRAAMAGAQLEELDRSVGKLGETAVAYREILTSLDRVESAFDADEVVRSAHYRFPVLLENAESRRRVAEILAGHGIETGRRPTLGELTLYAGSADAARAPNAHEHGERHLFLPLTISMGPGEVRRVCDQLAKAV